MKRTTRAVGSALLVGAVALFFGIPRSSAQDNNGQSEIQRGFSIAPVLLDLSGKQRGLVGLGSYYVNGVSPSTSI